MKNSIYYREKYNGLWGIDLKVPVRDSYSLSLVYTPGVGKVSSVVADDVQKSFILTNRGNSIGVITDGSTFSKDEYFNPYCAIPTVEAKAVYYREYGGIDAYPLVVDTNNPQELANVLLKLTPNFAGIDLLNVTPEISEKIKKIINGKIDIPVLYSHEYSALINKNNIFESMLFRAVIDTGVDAIPQNIFKIIEQLNCEDYKDFELAKTVLTSTAKSLIESGEAKNNITVEQIIEKYDKYIVEGKNSWFEKATPEEASMPLVEQSVELHRRTGGVVQVESKLKLKELSSLNDICSVDETNKVMKEIARDYTRAHDLTAKGNLVAVVSDGSAVLGLGNIGPEGALPVMEGKAALFKSLGGVDAMPICLRTQDVDELVEIISQLSPVWGGINLEDIAAPRCFEIEKKLIDKLNIPIFHDDQHGTAVVVLAGFLNALKLTGKKPEDIKIVINGAGAGAIAVTNLLLQSDVKSLILCDTRGAIWDRRADGMNHYKTEIAQRTNPDKIKGDLAEVIKGADFFIGLSAKDALTQEMVKSMNNNPVVFALANPYPEIMPDKAKEAGAFIVATGRSDFKNQVNNSLAFPGIFRGALDVKSKKITNEMKIAAAKAIADLITEDELNPEYIIPHALDLRVPPAVAAAVAQEAIQSNMAQTIVNPDEIFERVKNYFYTNLQTKKY